ncbi:transcription antitermination factor NusB [Nocardioides fonticola]|uniref:Transcription antitermination factor NusB n=1 Tax=Nocardioides fonticola TaxID=450363 RepID=A0ABP7XTE6_9ACTN
MRVDPARLAAYEAVRAVRVDGAYTNLVLPSILRRHGLSGRDAGFVTELVSGSVRGQGLYDAVLTASIDRPLRKVEAAVVDALRLGVHQLLAMRVPPHAALSTTVDLVRSISGPGAAGFANAVLRRVAQHDLDAWITQVADDADPTRRLATATSHPIWVVNELRQSLGGAAEEELEALLRADNEPPRVTLVARPGRVTRDELGGEPTPWSPYGATLAGGDPAAVPAVAEGRAGVQDEGSQLVAHAAATASLDGAPGAAGPDRTWLDLCAGPGGKSALLAGLADAAGARLVAVEKQVHRARLVARNLDGAAGVAGVLAADGVRPPFRPASFDRVLVDAPCTGLGALRRRPEARWRRRPDDLLQLVLLQRALVNSALDLVRPGGVVLYATCSPVVAETAEVVSSLLAQRDDVSLGDLTPVLEPLGMTRVEGSLPGTVQLWPHRHGTDAMFMALLRRH